MKPLRFPPVRLLVALLLGTATLVSHSATPSLWTRTMRAAGKLSGTRVPLAGDAGEVPRRYYPTLDVTRQATGVSRIRQAADILPFTGRGVTIAVIDGGIDPGHLAFSLGGNREVSRVVRYLRTASAAESESGEPEVVSYEDPHSIPPEAVDHECGGHGTHTSAIAGGAEGVSQFSGIAPEAELFMVSLGGELYDDEIAAGLTAALEYADVSGKPMVLNFSLGSAVGSHAGNNPVTDILRDYPPQGRIALFAAGNDGINRLSLTRDFSADPTELATAFAKRDEGTAAPGLYTEIYSSDSRRFEIALAVVCQRGSYEEVWRSPFIAAEDFDEAGLFRALGGEQSRLPDIGRYLKGEVILAREIDAERPYAVALHALFEDITLDSPYTLAMILRSPEGADILATTDYTQAYFRSYGLPGYTSGNATESISDLCTSPLVVSVGAWNARASWTDIFGTQHPLDPFYGQRNGVATYSSYGTARTPERATLPHVLAPGTEVISALPEGRTQTPAFVSDGGDVWGSVSGTSMATPAAAGIIALWLEACPTLTRDDVLEVIAATARHDSLTLSAPNGSAYGKLDAYEGLNYILHRSSLPGVILPEQKSELMIRCHGEGDVECSLPFPVTGGTLSVYTPQGTLLLREPLIEGRARLQLPAGIHILRATTPQGSATARLSVP